MRDYSQILDRYKRMRAASLEINRDLTPVCMTSIERAARDLGVWSNGTIVMDDIDDSAVLMDYAIHDCREDGRNAVQRYAAMNSPAPGSDAEAVLEATKQAFFSVFQVTEVIEGIGVRVKDILRAREHLLADVGFSQSAVPDVVLASRTLPFEDFIMTTGAALPVEPQVLVKIREFLHERGLLNEDMANLPAERWSEIARMVIRACLTGERETRVIYRDVEDSLGGSYVPDGSASPGRNEPCPCGSGRKYKKCCGR